MLPYSYRRSPNPHIYLPELIPQELYEQVRFPQIDIRSQGRSGRDLFMGEPGFEVAVSSPGIKELYDLFTSAEFTHWVLSIFAEDLERLGCRARAETIRHVPFLETRELLADSPFILDEDADPNVVFNRFDFAIGESDYTPYAHLDSIRRLVGGLLFFSDLGDEPVEGGEFILYRDLLFRDDRRPHWLHATRRYPPRGNTGVLFLNSNRGFHGPAAIESGQRKWIYYSISSHTAAWERHPLQGVRSLASRGVEKVANRLGIRHVIAANPESKLEANRLDERHN